MIESHFSYSIISNIPKIYCHDKKTILNFQDFFIFIPNGVVGLYGGSEALR